MGVLTLSQFNFFCPWIPLYVIFIFYFFCYNLLIIFLPIPHFQPFVIMCYLSAFLTFYLEIMINSLEGAKKKKNSKILCTLHRVSHMVTSHLIGIRKLILLQHICVLLCLFVTDIDSCNHQNTQDTELVHHHKHHPMLNLCNHLYSHLHHYS